VFQRAEAVDDLQQRVVDSLEGPGVALVGAPGQRFEGLEVFGEAGNGRRVGARSGKRLHRVLGRLARRVDDLVLRADKRAFDFVEARADVFEFGQRRSRTGKMGGQAGDLRLQAADQVRVD